MLSVTEDNVLGETQSAPLSGIVHHSTPAVNSHLGEIDGLNARCAKSVCNSAEIVTPSSQSEQSEINARLSGASVEHCTREAARLHRASEEMWDKQVASVDLWEGLPEGDPRIPDLMEETHQYEMVALILQHGAERMRVRADCYGF